MYYEFVKFIIVHKYCNLFKIQRRNNKEKSICLIEILSLFTNSVISLKFKEEITEKNQEKSICLIERLSNYQIVSLVPNLKKK